MKDEAGRGTLCSTNTGSQTRRRLVAAAAAALQLSITAQIPQHVVTVQGPSQLLRASSLSPSLHPRARVSNSQVALEMCNEIKYMMQIAVNGKTACIIHGESFNSLAQLFLNSAEISNHETRGFFFNETFLWKGSGFVVCDPDRDWAFGFLLFAWDMKGKNERVAGNHTQLAPPERVIYYTTMRTTLVGKFRTYSQQRM